MPDRSSDGLAEIERRIEHYRSILEKHKSQYEVLGGNIRKIEAELAETEKTFAEQLEEST